MKYLSIGLVAFIAMPALAQGNNAPPGGHAALPAAPAYDDDPPPADWLGENAPIPSDLVTYQAEARPYCPALDADSTSYFTCSCAVTQMTHQSWSDYDSSFSGPFMTSEDAKLILDSVKTSQNMNDLGAKISNGLSESGESVISACYTK